MLAIERGSGVRFYFDIVSIDRIFYDAVGVEGETIGEMFSEVMGAIWEREAEGELGPPGQRHLVVSTSQRGVVFVLELGSPVPWPQWGRM